MKQVAMVRVGIDTGCGGIHGPLFRNRLFEYIPIPDEFGIDKRTYGNTRGRYGRRLIDYFPLRRRERMESKSIHFDPEFRSYTYGDPTSPKAGLRNLHPGDVLIFYCGLQGWDFACDPALYLMGYFEVEVAGLASQFSNAELDKCFAENFHVRHRAIFRRQRNHLVLVKGTQKSHLLQCAIKISVMGRDCIGRPLKILSGEMQKIFGDFDGKLCFQRSPTRWVHKSYVDRAIEFIRSLK